MFLSSEHFGFDLTNSTISGAHFLLFLLLYFVENTGLFIALLVLIGILSFVAWLAAHHRYQIIAYTPSSRIGTAAQGYVELYGQADVHPDTQPIGFRSGPPSVWYRYRVQRVSAEGNWQHISSGTSGDSFELVDDTGRCVIDPEGAEVIASHKRSWRNDDYQISIRYFSPGDKLYVIGELAAARPVNESIDNRVEVSALLREWKKDSADFLRRFDMNNDGQVDVGEWDRAVRAAERNIGEQKREYARQPQLQILSKPKVSSRPFLISNRDPVKLAKIYRWWSWLHLAVFFSVSIVGWVGWES